MMGDTQHSAVIYLSRVMSAGWRTVWTPYLEMIIQPDQKNDTDTGKVGPAIPNDWILCRGYGRSFWILFDAESAAIFKASE